MTAPETYDVLIAGGGPAGLAAAAQAAAAGLRVGLADERASLGGQIFKQPGPGFVVRDHAALGRDHLRGRALIDAAEASGAELLLRTSVLAVRGSSVVLVEDGERARTVTARRLLIAAGAHDRPVVFPGWTLPGVLTAGGAQTLVKTQRVLPGERIVFAGSGPLALAFPAQLHGYGANVTLVLEAGPAPGPADATRLLRAARGNADLLRDAIRYRSQLLRARVPLRYRRIVVRAEGDGRVEAVTHAAADADWRPVAGTERTVRADTLCVGYGFTPSVELARLAGCALRHDEDRGGAVVVLDEWLRTSVEGVSAAGDGTGVDGSWVAEDEGRLAALGIARDLGAAPDAEAQVAPVRARIARRRAFAAALRPMHRVGPGIFELAADATVVCRCEEVTKARLDAAIVTSADLSVVKGLTRAGMGLCQGRNCQRQVAAMIAARHGGRIDHVEPPTPRLPARPVALGAIAREPDEDPGAVPVTIEGLAAERTRGPLPAETDVLVVGGGIAGAALAYELAKAGVDVVLVERGELNREASGTNAGSIHLQIAIHQLAGSFDVGAVAPRLREETRYAVEAAQLWADLEDELDGPIDLHLTGGLMVAEREDHVRLLHDKQRIEEEAGLETRVVEGAELRALAPYLSDRIAAAAYCPEEGHVNPLVAVPLFALRAVELGATIRTHAAVGDIEVVAEGGFRVTTSAGSVRAARVVNAAGAWARELGRMVGLDLPMQANGLHVNVTEPRARLLPPLIQHIGRRLTLKQAANGSFIIGGGWPAFEEAAPRRYSTAWESAAGNAAVAVDVVPALADVRLIRTWSGVIAWTDDVSPLVGESARVPGFHALVVGSSGYTMTPILARALAERMTSGAALADVRPEYSPDRLPVAASPEPERTAAP